VRPCGPGRSGLDPEKPKPRLVVVSPFLDKSHGTERIVVEWLSRLDDGFEIHLYSQRVEGVDLSKAIWHRIPRIPGPHLLNYLWWFAANHIRRSWDRTFRRLRADVVFSPGINCLDADIVSVHIVFAEYANRVAGDLRFTTHRVSLWPQILHRKLYYDAICYLEQQIYRDPGTVLVLMAAKTGGQLQRYYGRQERCRMVHLGVDQSVFNRERRTSLRERARSELQYSSERFVLLLIGNDWRNKGLPVLLEALEAISSLPIDLLVVGEEDPAEYGPIIQTKGLGERVRFAKTRTDVEFYYAAADTYVGPSLEDAFAMPASEAMACGLPVIVSSTAGVSEMITNRSDGLILEDPEDARSLASLIREVYENGPFRILLATRAAETARRYGWENSAGEFRAVLEEVLQEKIEVAKGERTADRDDLA
jgi:glycosyltransferase involved in cell wall biosynthesis